MKKILIDLQEYKNKNKLTLEKVVNEFTNVIYDFNFVKNPINANEIMLGLHGDFKIKIKHRVTSILYNSSVKWDSVSYGHKDNDFEIINIFKPSYTLNDVRVEFSEYLFMGNVYYVQYSSYFHEDGDTYLVINIVDRQTNFKDSFLKYMGKIPRYSERKSELLDIFENFNSINATESFSFYFSDNVWIQFIYCDGQDGKYWDVGYNGDSEFVEHFSELFSKEANKWDFIQRVLNLIFKG